MSETFVPTVNAPLRSQPRLRAQGLHGLFASSAEPLAKPVRPVQRAPSLEPSEEAASPYIHDAVVKAVGAGQTPENAPLKSDMALTLFQMADHDASSSLSLVEFEDLIHTVDPEATRDQILSIFQSIVCDEDSCSESVSFLGFYRWLSRCVRNSPSTVACMTTYMPVHLQLLASNLRLAQR